MMFQTAGEVRPSEKVVEEEGEEIVEEEENIEEKVEEEEEQVKEEAESEQEGATCFEVVEVKDVEKLKKNGALYCCIRHFLQSMLICLSNAIVFARSKRDWSYKAFGIESNQRGSVAEYFPTLGTNSLRKKIEHIENILNDTKKSHPLNQQSSSIEIAKKDNNNGRSSSEIPGKDTKNEGTSSRQEQIDDWYRKIKMEQKVFGRDKEVDDICGLFRKRPFGHSSKPYSVFGIHGISGSGKSTLANYICDHEKKVDDKHFDLIVFTHVSVTFRVEKIFRDMLREMEITGIQSESMDIVRLGKELTKNLEGRRFLLVLDDLWVKGENQKERDILLHALRAGRNGSIILVTAQNEDAAKTLGAQEQERMRIADLEEKVYLSLFMHHAEVDDDKRILFERIGAKIAERLHRLPIAAAAVARRLQPEKCPSKWEEKARELDVLNETMGVLWWSYQQLGVDTRRCFEYCSTFPRGYELKRDDLVRMWIAQGYVNTTMSNTSEELEDVGQRYIDELQKFSFLQVRETWRGKYITIHDLLHELAGKVAGSDFFRIELNSLQKDILPGVRHLFIETENVAEIAEKNQDLGNLRTLIIEEHHKDSDRLEAVKGVKISHEWEKIFECLLMRLRKLRVLIVNSDRKKDLLLPELIHQLKHLRYFQFDSHGWNLILPSTFSKLYHMQTIEGRYLFYPQGMANLIHLRHISGTPFFPNIGRLKSLQTMQYFYVRERQGHELKELKHLNKLRGTLMIRGLGYVGSKEEAQEADLASKKHIMELHLNFFSFSEMSRDAEVLEGLCPPKDLEKLTISLYSGSTYPSWMLSGQHPDAPKDLRKLEFVMCSFPLASIPEDSELFVRLHKLKIWLCNWDSLPENMVQLVSLRSLSIGHCNKMELLPTLPPSLEEISIDCCDVLSRTCKEEGHQNSQKIQHIPRKNIGEDDFISRFHRLWLLQKVTAVVPSAVLAVENKNRLPAQTKAYLYLPF